MELSDDQLDRLASALELLNEAEGGGGQGAKHPRVVRFKGDYAQLKVWVGRGRRDKMEERLNALLDHALKLD